MAAEKRLTYQYDSIGTIHCELLVHERGSWVNLPVYSIEQHDLGCQGLLITGHVESTSNQKFRALLTYNSSQRRTALWHLKDDILCSTTVDGRKKPVCEYTIRKNANDNPVDLTSVASTGFKPFANVPSEDLQCFSWRERDPRGKPIRDAACGHVEMTDLQSSLSFKLQTCKILRTTRDKSGRAAFPSTVPSETPGKNDKHFEPSRGPHERLSHYVHIEEGREQSDDEGELVPEFEATSPPFIEFRFYYKSRDLLEKLGINSGLSERPRRGLPSRKSAPDITYAWTSASQPIAQAHKLVAPTAHPASTPRPAAAAAAAAVNSRSPIASPSRQARQSSPELPSPQHHCSPFRKPKRTVPFSSSSSASSASHFRRIADRDPTPFHRPVPSSNSSTSRLITSSKNVKKRPAQQPASPERYHKKPTKPQPNTFNSVVRAATKVSAPTPIRAIPKPSASPTSNANTNTDANAAVANDQFDTSSLPSPPASPEPGATSDTSLPALDQIFPSRNRHSPQRSSTSSRPLASSSPSATQPTQPANNAKTSSSHNIRAEDGRFKPYPRSSPSRTQNLTAITTAVPAASMNSATDNTARATSSSAVKKTVAARPPLVPGLAPSTIRKTPPAVTPTLIVQSVAHAASSSTTPSRASQQQSTTAASATSVPLAKAAVKSADGHTAAVTTPPSSNAGLNAAGTLSDTPRADPNTVPMLGETAPQTPTSVRVPKQEDITPTATPSASTSQATIAAQAPTSSSTSNTVKAKVSKPAPERKIIDLTLDSDNESESDSKRDVKVNPATLTLQAVVPMDNKLAPTPPEDSKADIAVRQTAYKNAEDFLNALDIGDTGNVIALVSLGFKSTESFLKRLPLIDKDYRKSMAEDLAKEMGRVDYGILLTHLKQKGVDFGYLVYSTY